MLTPSTNTTADAERYALTAGTSGIWIVCLDCAGDDAVLGVLSAPRVRHGDVLALIAEHDAVQHPAVEPEPCCTVCHAEPAWDGPASTRPINAPQPIARLCLGCAVWVAAIKTRFAPGRLLARAANGAPTARIGGRLYVMNPDPGPQ